jgi:hypothetical protein
VSSDLDILVSGEIGHHHFSGIEAVEAIGVAYVGLGASYEPTVQERLSQVNQRRLGSGNGA